MALGGAGEALPRGAGEVIGEFRRCLRPSECPYAAGATLPLATPELWGAALAELLPGDTELAWEIADLLVAEGVLGGEDGLGDWDELDEVVPS
ncbi:MAG TPA: hypothetical protein VF112_05335 [Candidatus Dormibacteraeota bacterium]